MTSELYRKKDQIIFSSFLLFVIIKMNKILCFIIINNYKLFKWKYYGHCNVTTALFSKSNILCYNIF